MKEKKLTNKILGSVTIIFTIIFIYQITIAQNYSFSHDNIDHFFHWADELVISIILFLGITTLIVNSKKKVYKIIFSVLAVPTAGFFLLSFMFSSFFIFSKESTNLRHYFHEKDGYNYYIISERFVAFSGSSELNYYKEKPLFLFIKHRLKVTEEEIEKEGVNLDPVIQKFIEERF